MGSDEYVRCVYTASSPEEFGIGWLRLGASKRALWITGLLGNITVVKEVQTYSGINLVIRVVSWAIFTQVHTARGTGQDTYHWRAV